MTRTARTLLTSLAILLTLIATNLITYKATEILTELRMVSGSADDFPINH